MALICKSSGECSGCGDCQSELKVVYMCLNCNNEIFEGEDFYNVSGNPYCNTCVYAETAELEG